MQRREFITLLGSAAAWPLAARAQQPAVPVVGCISGESADGSASRAAAFRNGLNETGYVEGQNVTVEYHWLEGQYNRLPALLARPSAVIEFPPPMQMTSGPSLAPCLWRSSPRWQVRSVLALAAALATAPTSLLAQAQIQGSPEAVRIETQNSSIEDVLAALGGAFELRYRSSAKLTKQLSGTYGGSLQRVVARLLEGYDFVLRTNKGKIDITVLGVHNANPVAAVASSTPLPAKPASVPAPAHPAAAPSIATERAAAASAPQAIAAQNAVAQYVQMPVPVAATWSDTVPQLVPGAAPVAPPMPGATR